MTHNNYIGYIYSVQEKGTDFICNRSQWLWQIQRTFHNILHESTKDYLCWWI